ncbi:MAG: hypothetical protein HFE86_05255 [Clostridiales bacterium]|nr:hypothetical protein [Clostridiales bacterium]
MYLTFLQRRFLPLMLAAALLTSLAACSHKNTNASETSQSGDTGDPSLPDPAQVYTQAVNALQARLAGSRYKCATETRMDISAAAGSYSTYSASQIQVDQTGEFFMLVETDESAPKTSKRRIAFIDGHSVYMYEQGTTYRMDLDEQTKTSLLQQSGTDPLELDGVQPSGRSVKPLDTGGYEASLAFDAPSPDLVAKLLPSLRASVGDAPVNVLRLTVTAVVGGDGLLQSQSSEVQMELTVDGRQAQAAARITSAYSEIGGDFTIRPPREIDMAGALSVDDIELD